MKLIVSLFMRDSPIRLNILTLNENNMRSRSLNFSVLKSILRKNRGAI